MEEKMQQDQLEGLFKKSFEQLGDFPEKAGWNVPSDEVWEEVHAQIHPEPKRRIRPLWWWATAAAVAGVILLVGTRQHFYYQEQIRQLSDQLQSNEQKVQEMEAKIEEVQPKQAMAATSESREKVSSPKPSVQSAATPSQSNTQMTSQSVAQQSKAKTQKRNIIPQQKSATGFAFQQKRQMLPPINRRFFPGVRQWNTATSPAYGYDPQPTRIPRYVRPEKQEKTTHTTATLENLELAHLSMPNLISNSVLDEQQTLNPLVRLNSERPKDQWYVGGFVSPVWSQRSLRPNRNLPVQPSQEYEKAYTAGLQVGLAIHPNWRIETGVQYSSAQLDVEHSRKVPYFSQNEQLNAQGLYESPYDLMVATSTGPVETDVSLVRDPSIAAEDGDDINLALNLALENRHIEIPVISKYQVQFGPVGVNARAGIVSRYLIDQQVTINDVKSESIGFTAKQQSFRAPNRPEQASKLSFHYLLGFGLEYRFHPNWSIALEPTYQRGIRPLFEFNEQKVYQETFGLNIGVRYWL